MKRLKIVGIVLGALVMLGVIVLVLALTPAVQTWAVRKATAGQPGVSLDVTRVSLGFSKADLSDVRFSKDGVIVTAKAVTARYSAWDYLTKKRINVDSVTAQDLLIDLRSAKPSATAAPAEKSQPFQGVLAQAQLPFDVRLASLTATGRALLPGEQTVTFDLAGSDIATGQSGKLAWTVEFADAKTGAALQTLQAKGGATVHVSSDRRVDSIAIETTATLKGPKLPDEEIKLVATAGQLTAGGNESYTANVGLVRGAAIETIVKASAEYLAAPREMNGTWDVAVRSEQLAGLLAGLGLPEVAANGAGKFQLKPDTVAVSASGEMQGRVSQLQKLSPALEGIGSVQFKATFDGGMADDLARLDQLNLEVTGADGKKFAQISSLQKVTFGLADKRVTLADPKSELARISIQQLPLAWAQSLVKPMVIESGDLSLVLAIEAEPDGSRIRARAIEPLAIRTFSLSNGKQKLADQVSLTARPNIDYSATRILAQVASLNVTMPAGDALTGDLSAEVTNLTTTPVIAFTTQLQAKIVTALKPYLPIETGPLAVSASVEGRQEGQTVNLTKANATLNGANGTLLSALELQQPVRIDTKAMTFVVANPAAVAARVRVGQIPLSWAEGFVAKSKFAGGLTGGVLEVTMRSAEDLTVVTTEPLTLRGVSATMDGKPQAQNLDLTANLTATKRGETIAYDVRRIEVKQGETALAGLVVAGEAKLGAKLIASAKGNLEVDVAALMKQPALAEYATLSQGRLTGVFDANMADTIRATGVLTGKNLVTKTDNRSLGDLQVNLDANVKPDGSGTLVLPLTLTNATRKSDVSINGVFGRSTDQKTFLFTGKIASDLLVVEDFQPLAGMAPGGEKAKATPSPAPSRRAPPPVVSTPPASKPSTPDTAPFWKGVNGKVEMDLKRVIYGKDYVISAIRGTAVITDSRLSLDGLEGKFKENPFKVAATVTFTAAQAQPYALTGSADVANFDVGEFLRAANPAEKPALETKATVSAKLNGNGGNVEDLAKNAFGKFEVTGTQGTMRLLARKGGAGTAVNVASLGLAILGAARGSEGASALAEITRLLNEVPFESVKMQVERAPDLSFKLTSLEMVSPVMRMSGTGSLASKSVDDLQNAPMNIVLQLGAKEQLGYLLKRVGMLGEKQDDKGYQLMSQAFTVGGTPSKPDSSALWKMLGGAAAGALLR
ncbi:MAG: hypothetical protein ABIZ81_05070 [Opitutaceae bacterium]